MGNVISDVAFAFVGFFGGLAISFVYFKCRPAGGARPQPGDATVPPIAAPPRRDDAAPAHAAANDAARTSMAAQQLRDLAHNMAHDVGAHHSAIGSITSELTSCHHRNGDNSALVLDVVAKMLSANERLQQRLEEAERRIQSQADEIRTQHTEARTDVLTALANRRAFDDSLADNAQRHARDGRPFSLVLLDIDNFKKFNDAHGHLAGDEVLRAVGQTMTRVVKSGDSAFRYGGEEFAAILPGATIRDARSAAERVRKAIEDMTVTVDGCTCRVTASVGVAESGHGEATNRLFRRADDCLYEAKQAGRNRGYWHTGTEALPMAPESTPVAPVPPSTAAAPQITLPAALPQAQPASREVFAEMLNRRIAESHRSGAPLSVLMFRIHQLGEMEALYGVEVANVAFQWLSTFVRESLREMDVLGLANATELAAMLPGSTESAARIVGQRIASAAASFPIPLGQVQIRLDVVFGAASVGPRDRASDVVGQARGDLESGIRARATQLSSSAR